MKDIKILSRSVVALVAAIFGLGVVAIPANARDLSVAKPALACSQLAETDVDPAAEAPARIVTARVVTQGAAKPYCEVRGYVAPQVKFELRLPTETWTQRLMFSGCGGFCGRVEFRIRAAEGCAPLDNGELALVTSDLGHDTPDGNADTVWAAYNRPGKIDYGYRAVHAVTIAAKTIIARFYGQPQAYAYFNGCSDGGREAMMEVQRFPKDFDGVVAGAPVMNDTLNNTVFHLWNARQMHAADGSDLFRQADLELLHAAVLSSCDKAGDGIKDGVVGDPLACRFDPASIECKAGERARCLSQAQVAAARAMYAGATDPTGKPLFYGRPYGSELGWAAFSDGSMAVGFVRYMATDGIWQLSVKDAAFDRATVDRYRQYASVYDATDTDIEAFRSAGGKLIMWHGWADPGVPPLGTVDYYRGVQRKFGAATASFARLFMLPGVGHCQGGDGPDRTNMLDAIITWVEDGKAPSSIVAMRKADGKTVQTRPLFPFPTTAYYVGAGAPNQASSFKAAAAR